MLVPIIVAPTFFLLIGWIVWALVEWRRYKYQMNVQMKMVDKMGSAADMIQFVDTDGGRKFLETFKKANEVGTRERMLIAVRRGIILLVVGIAVVLMRNIFPDAIQALSLIGGLCSAFGVGYLLATAVSSKLARNWGIVKDKQDLSRDDA